jgi:hypothetical protein
MEQAMELLKTMQERMKTVSSLASEMNVNQNKWNKMDNNQDDMKAMMEACLEEMETNPGEMKSIAENQEVCNEEAAVEIIGATEDRTRDRAVPARCKGRRSRRDDGRARNATVE